MKLTHSYKAKIINVNDCLTDTILIYRKALAFIVDVVEKEWSDFDGLLSKSQINLCEKLIHKTKNNANPLYGEFDTLFYKYPSYLRRSTIQDAVGIVSSYHSNLTNWKNEKYQAMSNGKKFKKQKPKLKVKHFKCPTLYKGNMYLDLMDGNKACIKIYKINKKNGKGDWVWFNINLREQDLKYIQFNTYGMKEQSPTLIKNGKKYYLQFPFEQTVTLNNTKLKDTKVCAVDLGINHSAVCSIIDYNGTVKARKFINQPLEKDRQNRILKRMKKSQARSGNQPMSKIWAKVNSYNKFLVNDTVNKIIKFALKNKADVVVCEFLNFKGKKNNKDKAQQLHMWKCRAVIKKLKHNAHKYKMRFSRVNAKNTSALAFDGSGKVKRDAKNASLCIFPTGITPQGNISYAKGKQYNCDLNASYNIGARYFVKEILKSASEKKLSQFQAKAPEIVRRTHCTLSTLRLLVA